MGSLVRPRVYYVSETAIDGEGLKQYLIDSGNEGFLEDMKVARSEGLSDCEILSSVMAKLCYATLTVGHNQNISRTRQIADNVRGCFDQGHGSVFEHAGFSFIVRDCSRVFTHELVRHRVGTAFSQTSGRYVRTDKINFVFDPILEGVRDKISRFIAVVEDSYAKLVQDMGVDSCEQFIKKKLTSALRRILPNGQTNEIGFTVNIRSARHTVQMRTSRHAEWEIRYVYDQVYRLIKERHPLVFHGAHEEYVDGLVEVTGMRMQPYEERR
jgi:thymidylate synthase (FAD)